jgi:hypothetical protein
MKKFILSKSTFVKGNQCTKALYLNRFHKHLRDEMDESQEAVFTRGTNVGLLAQQLFPNGVDVSPEDYTQFAKSAIQTAVEIEKGTKTIYEATFIFDEVMAALDILVKHKNGWKAYEVKSSTSVTDTYILDAALQYHLITNSGIKLTDFFIVHINNQYTKNGALNIDQLFTKQSVLQEVLELQEFIPQKIKELKGVLKSKQIPETDIGAHCSSPYGCDFMGHCWKHVPEYSIFNIARLSTDKKFDLYYSGTYELNKLSDDAPLNDKQWQQVEAELNKATVIDKVCIKEFVKDLKYPLSYLDFETFQLAVPIFDNSRPYQQMVFQYSLHVQKSKNAIAEHSEFLAEANGKDPRIPFIEKLIKDCGTKGDILVYNIGFERGKLNDLAEQFPKYSKQIAKIVVRLKDLMIPFQQRWYYTHTMQGSYSIKKVLPALVPELSYANLEISNGGDASDIYAAMVQGTFEGDVNRTRQNLLEYCKLDTYAMVKIVEKLQNL